MFVAGNLLYFPVFVFEDGSSKPKYFLVLKVINQTEAILTSLPSSINHLPTGHEVEHGCLEMPSSCVNCYIFKKERPITKCNWSFPLTTMLYGNYLGCYSLSSLKSLPHKLVGELIHDEYCAIVHCFLNSQTVKKMYKRMLST